MAVIDEKERGKAGRKWPLSCCGGCAVVVLVIAIAAGIFVYFMARPHPVLPVETFLSKLGSAFLVAQVDKDDAAAKALLQDYIAAQADKMPLASWVAKEGVDHAVPVQLVVSARTTGGEGEFAVSGVASASGFVRSPSKFFLEGIAGERGKIEEYRGVEIDVRQNGVCLAIVENNLMLGRDKGMIKEWVNRIQRQQKLGEGEVVPYDGPAALKEMRGRLDPEAQVRLFSSNEHGEVKAFLGWVQQMRKEHAGAEPQWLKVFDAISAAEIDWSGVATVGATARLLEADTADWVLLLQCADEQAADHLRTKAVSVLGELGGRAGLAGVQTTLEGALLKVQFKTSEIRQMLPAAGKPSDN